MIAGQDGVHGYQELPRVPYIEGDLSTMPGFYPRRPAGRDRRHGGRAARQPDAVHADQRDLQRRLREPTPATARCACVGKALTVRRCRCERPTSPRRLRRRRRSAARAAGGCSASAAGRQAARPRRRTIEPSPAELPPLPARPSGRSPSRCCTRRSATTPAQEVKQVTMREPRAGDINRYGNPVRVNSDGEIIIDERKMTYMIAALANILPPFIEDMDTRDWNSCAYRIRAFFSARTGRLVGDEDEIILYLLPARQALSRLARSVSVDARGRGAAAFASHRADGSRTAIR